MLVRDRMSTKPVTILVSTPIAEALRTMRQADVRRMPVLDEAGKLVGIVSEKDLLVASPSPASSLTVSEVHYLLNHLSVSELMSTEVITISPDTPVEEAARIMADHKIGGLPVMESDRLVGIITETDVFTVLLEMFGAREKGLRMTLEIPERKGEIARISLTIAQLGGNILALGTFWGDDPNTAVVTIKVEDVEVETLLAAMRNLGLTVTDARLM
ncbi:MAG TPA: CBS and ACT domain-containing protein [Anaerolineae bacterium]|nr:CBS and ACT domain-containing protein [Anaerolineae bacterium]